MSITEIAVPTVPEAGGFWIRAAGRLIDWVVYLAVGFAVAIFLGISAGIYHALTGQDVSGFVVSMRQTSFISWIGAALGALAYHTLSEGIGGATIGKRLVGLQVNDVSQIPCSLKQAFKRSLVFSMTAYSSASSQKATCKTLG